MYPTISHLLKDLFGIDIPLPIQSFGFMMAMAFLAGAYALTLELKRKEKEGLVSAEMVQVKKGEPASFIDLISSFLIGFLLGYKFVFAFMNYDRFVSDPQGVILSMEGNGLAGIALGLLFAGYRYYEKNKEKLPEPKLVTEKVHPYQLVGNMTFVAAIAGIIGAKIFHNLENPQEFAEDPLQALISFSGLTYYGGLILGAVGVIWYANKHHIKPLTICDAAAPGLILAYAVGRIGCQLAGDGDWGIVNNSPKPNWLSFLPDWMWSFNYPHNVNRAGIPIPDCEGTYCYALAEPVWPTPFYETIMCLILFGVLWSLRKRITIPGVLFSLYLVLNGIERFLIEKIRVNSVYHIFGREITQAEIISSCLILIGIIGMIYFTKKHKKLSAAA